MRVDVSFVTATYNCLNYTKEFFESLKDTVDGINYEIIFVDDCSTDGTRDYLKSIESETVKVVLNEENQGFAANNNLGVEMASAEIVGLLNNDLLLKKGWLEPMLKAIKEFDKIGSVGNVQLNPKTELIDHAGIFFDLLGRPAHARKNRQSPPSGDYLEWNAVTAACMLIKKSVFDAVGGFDTQYINGCEDVDLCVRLKGEGYRHFVANKSVIYHHVSSSPDRHKFNDDNSKLFMDRWQDQTKIWGKTEWPKEYLMRYMRQWWRFNFTKLVKAVYLLLTSSKR